MFPASTVAPPTGWTIEGSSAFISSPNAAPLILPGPFHEMVRVHLSSRGASSNVALRMDQRQVQEITVPAADANAAPAVAKIDIPISHRIHPGQWALLLACLIASAGIHWALRRWAARAWVLLPRKRRVGVVIVSCVAAIAANFSLPVESPQINHADLEIRPIPGAFPENGTAASFRIADSSSEPMVGDAIWFTGEWTTAGDGWFETYDPNAVARLRRSASVDDVLSIETPLKKPTVSVLINGKESNFQKSFGSQNSHNLEAVTTKTFGQLLSGTSRLARMDWVITLLTIVSLWILIAALVMYLISRRMPSLSEPLAKQERRGKRLSRLRKMRFALPTTCSWVIALICLYPGAMSTDSVNQWRQSIDTLTDDHPFVLSLLWGTVRETFGNPFIIVLAFTLLSSLTVGYTLLQIRKMGASERSTWIGAIGVALIPELAYIQSTLWKDIPFSLGIVGLTGVLIAWYLEPDVKRASRITLLVLFGLAVTLSRHNGLPTIAIIAFITFWVMKPARWILTGLFACILGLTFLVNGPVASALDVQPSWVNAAGFGNHIAAHMNAGTHIDADDVEWMKSITRGTYPWPYQCQTIGTFMSGSGFTNDDFLRHEQKLQELATRLALRNPFVDIEHALCAGRIAWGVNMDADNVNAIEIRYSGGWVNYNYAPNIEDPRSSPPSPRVVMWLAETIKGAPIWFIRPAGWMWALFAIASCFGIRRTRAAILIAIPALAASLVVLAMVGSSDHRYQLQVMLLSPMLIPPLISMIRKDAVGTERTSSST